MRRLAVQSLSLPNFKRASNWLHRKPLRELLPLTAAGIASRMTDIDFRGSWVWLRQQGGGPALLRKDLIIKYQLSSPLMVRSVGDCACYASDA
jgi:hypothetical protein